MNEMLRRLSGGDLRSEGSAEEVAAEIVRHPELLADLAAGLQIENKLIRARTCMAMEVISRDHPELLTAVLPELIVLSAKETVAQARWHLAQIFGNTPLAGDEAERIIPILLDYLEDKSKIVKYCAVQTLGVLGRKSPSRAEIIRSITARKDESKSMAKAVTHALRSLAVPQPDGEPGNHPSSP